MLDTVTSLHLLPFRVQYSGPARIKGHFTPTEHQSLSQAPHNGNGNGEGDVAPLQRAYFRGRMLLGSEIRLPQGYAGQVWRSNGPTISSLPSQQQRQAQTPRAGTHAPIPDLPYGPDSPRRSPRKQAAALAASASADAPPAKRLKLDGAAGTKKQQMKKQKVKKKRETFDMSPDLSPVKKAEQPVDEPLELEALPLDGLPVLVGESDGKGDGDAGTPAAVQVESGDIVAVPSGSPTKHDAASAEEAGTSKADEPVKLETALAVQDNAEQPQPPPPRASTPPPPLPSSTPISIPSTPAGDSKPLTLNIATPKPFAAPLADDSYEASGEQRAEAVTERILQPIADFKAFTVWNPDTEVDAGEDAYIRAIAEWTKLAALVRFGSRLA